MMIRFAIVPLLLALNFSMCKKHETVSQNQPGGASSPAPGATAAPPVARSPKVTKPVVDQTAQTIIFCYHLLVDKVRYPGTEITPAAFEAQMKELKDRGITVISMQDLLAWKRGEKNIPPRCAIITFDDGYKSQYEVAWPIMKKYGYPFTMFIYTEGVRGGSLGGGGAITWEQLADMRDNGVDIEAHSATHQDLREGHTITLASPGGKKTRTKLTGAQYEQWVQNEVVGCKQLLEQRLAAYDFVLHPLLILSSGEFRSRFLPAGAGERDRMPFAQVLMRRGVRLDVDAVVAHVRELFPCDRSPSA